VREHNHEVIQSFVSARTADQTQRRTLRQ
jgi:hypothetical protein